MCYAIPGRVLQVEGQYAVIDYFGEERRAKNELVHAKKGEYIYAQGGFVIKIVPKGDALETLKLWKDVFISLQKTDVMLSKLPDKQNKTGRKTRLILDRASNLKELKKEELLHLLSIKNADELKLLYSTANFMRQKYLKNSCCVHGIIEFSNYCMHACSYCGISVSNKKLFRYRMTKDEILSAAKEAVLKYGFQALVLQSGEDPHYSIDFLCEVVRYIRQKLNALVFVSFGEIGIEAMNKLYDACARGLLMRFETSNKALFHKLHPALAHKSWVYPDRELKTRIEHLKQAYKKGYLILTGGLIGLPGQTREDILEDILFAKELNAEMYSFGPFITHPDTVLAGNRPPSTDDILKVIAVLRLIDPQNAKILVTTGFETIDKDARKLGLMAGANSVMINVTPEGADSKHYSIYPKRAHEGESIQYQIDITIALLKSLGRAPTDLSIKE